MFSPQNLLNKDEESNREFKVRIVERLTFLEQKLHSSTEANSQIEEISKVAPALESSLF